MPAPLFTTTPSSRTILQPGYAAHASLRPGIVANQRTGGGRFQVLGNASSLLLIYLAVLVNWFFFFPLLLHQPYRITELLQLLPRYPEILCLLVSLYWQAAGCMYSLRVDADNLGAAVLVSTYVTILTLESYYTPLYHTNQLDDPTPSGPSLFWGLGTRGRIPATVSTMAQIFLRRHFSGHLSFEMMQIKIISEAIDVMVSSRDRDRQWQGDPDPGSWGNMCALVRIRYTVFRTVPLGH